MTLATLTNQYRPYIIWNNLFLMDGASITAESSATGYDKEYAYDDLTYRYWKASAAGNTWLKVSFAAPVAVTCLAIGRNDMYTNSCQYKLQYSNLPAPGTGDGDWTDAFAWQTPASDIIVAKIIDSVSALHWRFRVNSVTAASKFADIMIGTATEIPQGFQAGFSSPYMARQDEILMGLTQDGNPTPRSVLFHTYPLKAEFADITPTWMRANWYSIVEYLTHHNAYLMWNPKEAESEVLYFWPTTQAFAKAVYSSAFYVTLSLQGDGIIE